MKIKIIMPINTTKIVGKFTITKDPVKGLTTIAVYEDDVGMV
jgi:hypothetical protein